MTVGDRSGLRGLQDVLREIRAQVRDRRHQLGLTQRDVAAMMGTTQSQFSGWEGDGETARQDMFLSSVFRAAHVLGLEVEVTLRPRER